MKLKLFFLIVSIYCSALHLQAQNNNQQKFDSLSHAILQNKPKDFAVLDSLFRPFRNDTTLMKAFEKKANTANYNEGKSYALNMIGVAYRNFSKYNEAITYHNKALQIAKKAKNKNLEIVSYNMIGVVYRRQDLIRSALDFHKLALDIAESITNPTEDVLRSIAVSLNSMGNIYLALEQYELAISIFTRSMDIERQLDNKLGLAINYQNIGYANEALGHLDDALKDYKESLRYNNEINSQLGKVICNNSIGVIYIKQNHFNKANDLISKTLAKAEAIGDQYYIANTYINYGWAQTKLKHYPIASEYLQKGLVIAQKHNMTITVADAYKHLSEFATATNKHDDALTYYKKYDDIQEKVSSERNIQYVNDLIMKYESDRKANQIKTLSTENELVKLKLAQHKKTIWFSISGFIILVIFLLVLYKQFQLKNEKRIITLEQNMLRTQMNPHFIFNSLNSIKLYIINNEKENAVFYLNKFSKLMRKILMASSEKNIPLQEELETMKLYVNIENIRFNNEILYQEVIDDAIDVETIHVPSLILQPFLENAIWHGLSLKETDKKITLEIKKQHPNFITINIIDNGVGRKASEEIHQKNTIKRKSVGIEITKERLANFSKQFSNMYQLDIEDLEDASGNALGTKIIINIPV